MEMCIKGRLNLEGRPIIWILIDLRTFPSSITKYRIREKEDKGSA
jgi:hypothetical protein